MGVMRTLARGGEALSTGCGSRRLRRRILSAAGTTMRGQGRLTRKPATKLQLVCLERSGFMPIAKESCRHLTIADIYGVF